MWDGDNTAGGGELVADVLHDWASPEINYSLTVENIAKFRHLLLTGEDTFTKEDVAQQPKKRKNQKHA